MIVSADLIVAILETMSYESGLTITGFPCSITIREGLANVLVDIGFIELIDGSYKITDLGTQFLNNQNKHSTM
jgi:predicted transcriptional regulator